MVVCRLDITPIIVQRLEWDDLGGFALGEGRVS